MPFAADTLTHLLLSIIVFFMTVVQCIKIKEINAANMWKLLFYMALIVFVVAEYLCLNGNISYFRFEGLSSLLLAFMHSLVLTAIAFLSVREFTKLKIRALWKVPIIGCLFGLFALEHQILIHIGLYFISLYIFYQHRQMLISLQPKIFGLLIWTFGLAFIRENGFWYLNIVLIFFSLLTYSLWDMVVIKLLVWNKNEKTS